MTTNRDTKKQTTNRFSTADINNATSTNRKRDYSKNTNDLLHELNTG